MASTPPGLASFLFAVECDRRVIALAGDEPYFYDPHFIDHFRNLIDRLERRASAAAE